MDRRTFLQLVAGGLVAVATPRIDSGLEMIAEVEAKEPKTVDDILTGTSFQNVCSSDYSQKTKEGNVVVFFYDDDDGINDESGRLAQIFKVIEPKFNNNVNFLKYKYSCDASLSPNKYGGLRIKFGVTGIPQVNFYKNGQLIDILEGGPKPDFHLDVWVNDFRKGLSKLYK